MILTIRSFRSGGEPYEAAKLRQGCVDGCDRRRIRHLSHVAQAAVDCTVDGLHQESRGD